MWPDETADIPVAGHVTRRDSWYSSPWSCDQARQLIFKSLVMWPGETADLLTSPSILTVEKNQIILINYNILRHLKYFSLQSWQSTSPYHGVLFYLEKAYKSYVFKAWSIIVWEKSFIFFFTQNLINAWIVTFLVTHKFFFPWQCGFFFFSFGQATPWYIGYDCHKDTSIKVLKRWTVTNPSKIKMFWRKSPYFLSHERI